MAFTGYLTTEVVEDWEDGLISRREALRRLALLGMSASAATAFLAAHAGPAGAQTPSASSSTDAGASPALDPALPPGMPGIPGVPITFPGPRGELQGHLATPDVPGGAVLVVHENRGLTPHIRSVAERIAGLGYTALAVDLLSEEGGTAAIADEGAVSGILSGATPERLVGDMQAALDELERRAPGVRLGAIGFCFGGAMVWSLLHSGEPRLAAAIPFYGPGPETPDFTGDAAAVLGVYAENDDRVNASQQRVREALEAAGLTHRIAVYPGAGHAFFNDTGGRYDPVQAAAAWADVTDWFAMYLAPADPSTSPSPGASPSD